MKIVVLLSGTGSLARALVEACHTDAVPATVVAVGSDRPDIAGLGMADQASIPTFVCDMSDFANRDEWDAALTTAVANHAPDLVVLAGFMKITGPAFLAAFEGRTINCHPALCPSFPGAHAVRDAVDYGVKVTGATVFMVDPGLDTGPILAQQPVLVQDNDTVDSLHERIKVVERDMLVDVVGRMAREGWTVEGRKVTIP